jgi:predicted  nucleic acid-binding Zn-ribbon protein
MNTSDQLKQTQKDLRDAIDTKKLENKSLQGKSQDLSNQKTQVDQQISASEKDVQDLEQQVKMLDDEIQAAKNAEKLL